jgi:hypothetical protein
MDLNNIVENLIKVAQNPSTISIALFIVAMIIIITYLNSISDKQIKGEKVHVVYAESIADLYTLHIDKINEDVIISEVQPTKKKISEKLRQESIESKKKAKELVKNMRDSIKEIQSKKPQKILSLPFEIKIKKG